MKTKIITIGAVTILLLAATLKLKSNKREVESNVYQPDINKSVMVEAKRATVANFKRSLGYTGTFEANREVLIIPQVHGEVRSIGFEEGQSVQEGHRLVQIDDDLLQAQYMAAEAAFINAKRNVERHESAAESGGVSALQLDNFRLTLKSSESQLKQLAKQITLCSIEAPFSGKVTFRNVEIGSVVGSEPIARITDLSLLQLEISVPEKEIVFFTKGETANISTDVYPGQVFSGKIDYVSDRADNAHNYVVHILVKNTEAAFPLKAGMYGTLEMHESEPIQSLLIPRTALLGSAKNPQVFVVDNNKAVLKNIQTGHSSDDAVEVLSGINAGDMVVTTGHINLTNGSLVSITK